MKSSNFKVLAAVTVATCGVTAAHAGDICANYSFVWSHYVDFNTSFAGPQTALAAQLKGVRTGGTDTLVGNTFYTFCIELGELINPANNPICHNDVLPLNGSTTNTGGLSGPVFYDPLRNANMECLFGGFFSTTFPSSDDAAAFQLAVWETAFDTDLTLLNSGSSFWGKDTDLINPGVQLDSISTKAENMLAAVKGGTITNKIKLLHLKQPGLQDLVTPVPEPATMTAMALGALALIRKRKSK